MRLIPLSMIFVLSATLIGIASTAAKAQGACSDLWVARNAIYKNKGYCFKTDRAISYFGNAGCVFNYEGDVPLSRGERSRIAGIQAQERALGCR